MISTHAVYSIGLLPVDGTDDLAVPIRDYFKVLQASLRIIDAIRTGPLALTPSLETELDSARYHLATMISLCGASLSRSGTDYNVSAASVPGISAARDRYLAALLRAKGAWNAWLDDWPLGYAGFGADGTAVPTTAEAKTVQQQEAELLESAKQSRSRSIPSSFVYLGLGLGVAALIGMFRR